MQRTPIWAVAAASSMLLGCGDRSNGVAGGCESNTNPSECASAGGAAGAAGAAGANAVLLGQTAPPELAFVVEPSFTGSPNPATAQVGVLRLQANRPVSVEVTVSGGDEEWTLATERATPNWEKPVLGLKPQTSYEVEVTASDGEETLVASGLEWTTPPLPEPFPRFDLVVSNPEAMEPGMTLFNARSPSVDFMVIIDHEGTVRWYNYAPEHHVQEEHRRLASGNFLYIEELVRLVEVDVLGNEVASWYGQSYPQEYTPPVDSTPVMLEMIHHEARVLENGDYLTLSSALRTLEDYPTSEDDPDAPTATAEVLDNEIVEFRPTGEVVKRISLMDILDPRRIGRDSLSPIFWMYGPENKDWGHANAIVYDDRDDSYVVSLRHQDAVVKIRRDTEELVWILGSPSNWVEPWASKLLQPIGDLTWPYHQHAVELTDDGLGLYDNGNYRAGAYEDPVTPEYSRAVRYEIDEANMTVREVWSYGAPEGEESFYSWFMGDADWQPSTGNVLIVNGAIRSEKFGGSVYGQLFEVTHGGERVFQLDMGDPTESGEADHFIYRAQRLPDIRQ